MNERGSVPFVPPEVAERTIPRGEWPLFPATPLEGNECGELQFQLGSPSSSALCCAWPSWFLRLIVVVKL